MNRRFLMAGFFMLSCWARGDSVWQSGREIPIVGGADVIVVGGTAGGVSAAVQAAREGADVFLVTSRSYLGDDLCATYRYWLDPNDQLTNPLEINMYMPSTIVANPLSYSYEYDRPSVYPHWDTWPPSMLYDGKWQYMGSQSVQFNSDVTITADLGQTQSVIGVYLVSYYRTWEYGAPTVTLYQSNDGVEWQEAGSMEIISTDTYYGFQILSANVPMTARYVKVACQKNPGTWRMLLGELLFEDSRIPPAPIRVKKTLDEALMAEQVRFLTGSYVTDLIRDQQNQPAGVVIANRAGRQAITAPVIIDATLQATAARAAGVQFRAMDPNDDCTFKRVVIGYGILEDPNLHPRAMPTSVRYYPATEYSIVLSPEEDSLHFYAEAEQSLRDRTWVNPVNVQKDASETVFSIPPRSILGKAREEGPWRGAEFIDPNIYCPADIERFYVLSGYADMSRDCAEDLLKPLHYMRAGTRVGSLAAQAAAGAVLTGPLSIPGEQGQASVTGDVLEFLNGARPVQECLSTVPCPSMLLPVWGQYDVIVVGGGTSGAPAAIAAARKGMKTLVIEYQYGLGGVGTLGLIGSYASNAWVGFTHELDLGVTGMGGKISGEGETYWNPQVKMEWYRSQLRTSGADIWFGTLGAGAIVENHTVKGVVVATDYGRAAVLGKIVIDSTGNSDIAASAGGDTMFVDAQSIALQGTGLPFRQLGDYYRNTDWTLVDDSDAIDQWRTFLVARNRYSTYYDMGTLIDSRERRRIVGDYILTPLDILNYRTYPDTIMYSSAAYDSHGFMVHPYFLMKAPPSITVYAKVPYRCLLPEGLEGILVTGLGISAHRDALPPIRMQPDLQNMGYAAGLAASKAIAENRSLREINIRQLQTELVQKGNLPTSVLSEGDSFPLSQSALEQAVTRLPNGFDGLEVVLTQPEAALPLLQNAYAQADPGQKLIYAEVLGFLGDATGIETLIDSIRSQPWGNGWVYVAGGWGKKLSELDSQIIALGLTRDSRAINPIIEKLQDLDEEEEFSHFMAAAFAADALESPLLAPALAEVLDRSGISENWLTWVDPLDFKITSSSSDNQRRERSFRELLLAKALCQSGDYYGLAHQTLMSYENDIRGPFSRYAHDVLKSKSDSQTCDCLDHVGQLFAFAEFWLMDVQNEYFDFSHDGRIDLNDFVYFASEWMECPDWPSSTLPTYW